MPLNDVRAGPTYPQASTLTFDDIPEKRRVMSHRSPAADQRRCGRQPVAIAVARSDSEAIGSGEDRVG